MSRFILLNDEIVRAEDALLSVSDGGFLHGAGLFETMRAEHGRVFRLEAHLARLMNSAGTLLSPIARDSLPTADDLTRLLSLNELRSARIRLTLSSGPTAGPPANQNHAAEPTATVCVTAVPLEDYPAAFYERGVGVIVSRFRQSAADPLAGHKCTSYLGRLLALRDAQRAGCAEALWFTPQNLLAEGSITNVFIVKGGELVTPPLDTPVLPGIARAVVIERARGAGIAVRERPVNINDLLDADEVFLTNAIMRVMPVVRVEKRDIRDGRPGALSQRLLDSYRTCVQDECGAG